MAEAAPPAATAPQRTANIVDLSIKDEPVLQIPAATGTRLVTVTDLNSW
ncbi:hypothetical protein ACFV6F_38950 [Kitasatospora phosalacinea]